MMNEEASKISRDKVVRSSLFLILHSSFLISALLFLYPAASAASLVKDVAYVQGVRDNQLFGAGLVVGLNGTGDSAAVASKFARSFLERMKISLTPADIGSKNTAAVMLTATLGPFARKGSKIDVTVSSLGDATSLQGGVLLLTPLEGPDAEVYAVAQGSLSVGGFSYGGEATQQQKNHPTVGHVPEGALVENELSDTVVHDGELQLVLRHTDFTTATRLATAVNEQFADSSYARDAATVSIKVPDNFANDRSIVQFIALLENLSVEEDSVARVVINERTGTVVAHNRVRIKTAAIAQGNITVVVREQPEVSQPGAFARGTTAIVPRTELEIDESKGFVHVMQEGATIADLARGLNAMGVTPRDIIAIFLALRKAGALQAELEIM
ncbi:MAG TPA: flagellar basal body P-ring protein FlgI [Planctomycetota bacterium]|nr:flagellar basal body P-ring protein FlgI [Planctomycetota bacterium]